jgi:hypothetical protein
VISFLVVGAVGAGQPGARCVEAADRCGDLGGPGRSCREEEEAQAAAAADDAPGGGEDAWCPWCSGKVLTPRPAPVAQLQGSELAALGAGGEADIRCPSRSVNRIWAPGWGVSLRTITRIPCGQEEGPAGRALSPPHQERETPRLAC